MKLRVYGWNLGSLSGRELGVDGATDAKDSRLFTWRSSEFENALTLPLGDGPEWLEADFLARSPALADLAPPFALTGCIEKIGEEDRVAFTATKGEKLLLEIQSASLGFPLDAWLAIQNAAGKELIRNDDGTNADPVLEWTAPESGSYVAVVGSMLRRAGADHLYRLSLQSARPAFKGVIAESGFTIEPGKAVKIKVTARRVQGFKSKLTAGVAGLPAGLVVSPAELGETEKEITLELKASAEAGPFSGPFEIYFREENSDTVHLAVHELISTTSRNGVPGGFRELVINSTPQLWLTVSAAAPVKAAEPAEEK